MENRVHNDRYQALRHELESNAWQLHHRNKQRIKAGIISLLVLPFVLCFVRWVTESDKIVFMLIWILLMFILCSYLIGVGYMDDWLQKILGEMTGEEESFDSLLADPDEVKAEMKEKLRERIEARAKGAPVGESQNAAAVSQDLEGENLSEEGGCE